jgi:hypothetical protein
LKPSIDPPTESKPKKKAAQPHHLHTHMQASLKYEIDEKKRENITPANMKITK